MKQKRVAIYPGTFDPVTNGHIDIIRRALNIFDKLIVSVALNPRKNPLFSIEQRVDFIQQELEDLKNATLKDVRDFYEQWYGPNNATMVIAGDINKGEVKSLVQSTVHDLIESKFNSASLSKLK